nr:hypothetical protein [Mycoplasmopsis bovis]
MLRSREISLGGEVIKKTFLFLPDKFFIGDKEFLIINLLKHPGVSADVISNNWSTTGIVLEKTNTFARIALSILPYIIMDNYSFLIVPFNDEKKHEYDWCYWRWKEPSTKN